MEYMSKGKSSEAQIQLNRFVKAAKTYFVETGGFPTGGQPPMPSDTSPCGIMPGNRFPQGSWPSPGTHPASPFEVMEFRIDESIVFVYSVLGSGTASTMRGVAVADLDCQQGGALMPDQPQFTTFHADLIVSNNSPAASFTRNGFR